MESSIVELFVVTLVRPGTVNQLAHCCLRGSARTALEPHRQVRRQTLMRSRLSRPTSTAQVLHECQCSYRTAVGHTHACWSVLVLLCYYGRLPHKGLVKGSSIASPPDSCQAPLGPPR